MAFRSGMICQHHSQGLQVNLPVQLCRWEYAGWDQCGQGKLVPPSSPECWNTAARERGLETIFALQPPQGQWFVAVERSHEVGDVGQRGTWHNKSRLKYIFNLGMCS